MFVTEPLHLPHTSTATTGTRNTFHIAGSFERGSDGTRDRAPMSEDALECRLCCRNISVASSMSNVNFSNALHPSFWCISVSLLVQKAGEVQPSVPLVSLLGCSKPSSKLPVCLVEEMFVVSCLSGIYRLVHHTYEQLCAVSCGKKYHAEEVCLVCAHRGVGARSTELTGVCSLWVPDPAPSAA